MKPYAINLLPFGDDVAMRDLQILKEKLTERLSFIDPKIIILKSVVIPKEAYNPSRDQYLGKYFLKIAKDQSGNKVLGITNVDLYTPELNFIFGQAEINGKACVISLNRLKYGVTRPEYIGRMIKEAVHEIGHTFGLRHCSDKFCVMHFSNCLADTDIKGEECCDKCQQQLIKRR